MPSPWKMMYDRWTALETNIFITLPPTALRNRLLHLVWIVHPYVTNISRQPKIKTNQFPYLHFHSYDLRSWAVCASRQTLAYKIFGGCPTNGFGAAPPSNGIFPCHCHIQHHWTSFSKMKSKVCDCMWLFHCIWIRICSRITARCNRRRKQARTGLPQIPRAIANGTEERQTIWSSILEEPNNHDIKVIDTGATADLILLTHQKTY